MSDLSRRFFLKAVTGAAIVTAVAPEIAQATPEPESKHKNLIQMIQNTASNTDVLCLGDLAHTDHSLREPLTDPAVLEAMKKSGYTDVYLEVPKDLNGLAQDYYQGKITREEFSETFLKEYQFAMNRTGHFIDPEATKKNLIGQTARIIDAARSAGVNIHFADPQSYTDQGEFWKNTERYNTSRPQFPEDYNILRYAEEHRLQKDPEIAKHVAKTKRGKAAIFYGAFHFILNTDMNIDNALRDNHGLRTTVVSIKNNDPQEESKFYREIQEDALSYKTIKGFEAPLVHYSPKTDTVTGIHAAPASDPTPRAKAASNRRSPV